MEAKRSQSDVKIKDLGFRISEVVDELDTLVVEFSERAAEFDPALEVEEYMISRDLANKIGEAMVSARAFIHPSSDLVDAKQTSPSELSIVDDEKFIPNDDSFPVTSIPITDQVQVRLRDSASRIQNRKRLQETLATLKI